MGAGRGTWGQRVAWLTGLRGGELPPIGEDHTSSRHARVITVMAAEPSPTLPPSATRLITLKPCQKGNLSDCNNWRGITLLSIPGKVFCSVLLQRLKTEVDNILREEQAGFRKGRSCSKQIFTLRNIIEQCLELQTTLIINYIDFKKAFDSVHRESLWQIIQLYGVPSKYVNIFRALYHNSTCLVRTSSGTTNDFDIVTSVRQGCILSPLLFLIVINFVMRKTLAGTNYGIKWGQDRLTDLDFADDLALFSHTHHALQEMTSNLHEHGGKVGLRISHEKTKAMIIRQDQHHPPLSLGEHDIEYVDNFTWRRTCEQELAKLQECSNGSATYGRPMPSLRPSSYASTCQWSFQQRPTPARRG
ncbi:hypothetical protein AAFF_G00438300 [Aldrovandia affinis]|uniref:Reverse transcriptase domain-containing protein n=1 Tax=Aldrovandia affinis TaxID=143900 RepID=A0AAD7S7V4_9TELE|nr:hypothetical protein AAFF_G00438300 [Aldrovandia affinis]